MKDKIIKVLLESIDLNKLADGLLDDIVKEALDKIVADSANTFDDAAMAMLYPLLSSELKKLVAKLVEDLNQPHA